MVSSQAMPDPVAVEDLSELGRFLRTKRDEKRLSQNDVSKAVGIAQSTLSEYERGVLLPSLSAAKRLAELLECTIDDIAAHIHYENA